MEKLDSCRPYYDSLLEWGPRIAKGDEDPMLSAAVERCLHVAIECAIDVGEMVIAWKRWERADDNKDVFRILGARGAIPADLAGKLAAAAGLRNLLVHRYGALDRAKVKKAILHDLGDLDAYAKGIARFVRGET